MAGLDSTGFTTKTREDIDADLQTGAKSKFGAAIRLAYNSVIGNLIAVIGAAIAELWEVAQANYSANDPDAATGARLDALCALTGTVRLAAAPSTVTLACCGTPGTVLAVDRVATVTTTGIRFVSTVEATILAVDAWVAATAYVVDDEVYSTISGTSRVYRCTVAGTSHATTGPSGETSAVTDNTATWAYLGRGTGFVDVAYESEDTGPKVAAIGTLVTIGTPVAGWSTVRNLAAAVVGNDLESDAELRQRREDELADGGLNIDSIRAALLEVSGVTQVSIFANTSNTADGDGVPAHAIVALVLGGAAADIREALWDACGGVVQTYGTTSGTITDSQGFSQTVKFQRPTEKRVYIDVILDYDADDYPTDGDAQVKAALVAYGAAALVGQNVVASRMKAAIFADVDGILDVSQVQISYSAGPTVETTLAVSLWEIMTIATADISVTSSSATP